MWQEIVQWWWSIAPYLKTPCPDSYFTYCLVRHVLGPQAPLARPSAKG